MTERIEVVDVGALASPPSSERDAMDRALGRAAEHMGFLVISGGPVAEAATPATIESLVRLFDLPAGEKQRLLTRKYAPDHGNSYHGMFNGFRSDAGIRTEGFDLGSGRGTRSDDPIEAYLMEPNVWPDETLLPGWRAKAEAYYVAMERIGGLLMASLARHLGLGEDRFARHFTAGVSTLRLLHIDNSITEEPTDAEGPHRAVIDGRVRRLGTAAHRDSGILTLLWQPGLLQAEAPDGTWLDAPSLPGSLNVNFGDCMALWTGGRIQATPHRVLARPGHRYSIPFFYEPDVDTRIAPLTGEPGGEPVRYGNHVLAKIRLFGTHAADHVAA